MAGPGSDLAHPGLAIVIMGVSGCGKSTVAARLAAALGCSFIEADDYHSQANKAKMSKGVPLTDADRAPWLESLRGAIKDRLDHSEDVAVSCSALQLKYREILREGGQWLYPRELCNLQDEVCVPGGVSRADSSEGAEEGDRRRALHASEPGAEPARPATDRRG